MNENYHYAVKTTYKTEDDRGKIKHIREVYLIEAVSPTDAEAITIKNFGGVTDFRVRNISEMRFNKILLKD